MAENEAKARKKLEDAEKKAKGGSGFFSGLFGNAKAEEAADLFVQVSILQSFIICMNLFVLFKSCQYLSPNLFLCHLQKFAEIFSILWDLDSAYTFSIPFA